MRELSGQAVTYRFIGRSNSPLFKTWCFWCSVQLAQLGSQQGQNEPGIPAWTLLNLLHTDCNSKNGS